MPRREARGGAAAATARLQEQIAERQCYEALQTARALFARYVAQGKSGAARELALTVAKTFAEAGESKSALDLARLYMSDNTERGAKVMEVDGAQPPDPAAATHQYSSSGRANMLALAKVLPAGPEKVSLLKGLAKWGLEETRDIDGEVNLDLAMAMRELKDYGGAAQRLALADAHAAGAYVDLLAEWAPEGYHSERDLFVARAVLHVLSFADPSVAATYARALADAAQAHSSLGPALTDSSIFHYVVILLDLIQFRHRSGSLDAFRHLCNHYERAFARDPDLLRMRQKVAEVYFNVMPPPNPMSSLLSMLGGGS